MEEILRFELVRLKSLVDRWRSANDLDHPSREDPEVLKSLIDEQCDIVYVHWRTYGGALEEALLSYVGDLMRIVGPHDALVHAMTYLGPE